MNKIRLDLDALTVETFTAGEANGDGTVQANMATLNISCGRLPTECLQTGCASSPCGC
jgi:hypothetical protein